MKKITLLLVVFLATNILMSQDIYKRISIPNANPEIIQRLDNLGIDLTCGVIISQDQIQMELNEHSLKDLENIGINYNVLIDNMQSFYSKRAIKNLPRASMELQQAKAQASTMRSLGVNEIINNVGQHDDCDEIDWAVPANWNLNDADNYPDETNHFGGCLTYDMVLQELDDMKALYPNLISKRKNASPSKQLTIEGRTVWMVRISDNPEIDEPTEPENLYQSLIHSREGATVMNQLYFMW